MRRRRRRGCRREAVSDVGQVAFVEVCADDIALHADVGVYELLVGIVLRPSLSQAAARAALVTLGRTAGASLRG